MSKYRKLLKILGIILLSITLLLLCLEASVPGMEGVHWFGIYTFMPGLVLYQLGKTPLLEASENVEQTKTLGPVVRIASIVLTIGLLLFALPILANLIYLLS